MTELEEARIILAGDYRINLGTTPEEAERVEKFNRALDIVLDALERLEKQNEVIQELLKVGYPHNFQREKPWIVNYMYAITEVVKKVVQLESEVQDSKKADSPQCPVVRPS